MIVSGPTGPRTRDEKRSLAAGETLAHQSDQPDFVQHESQIDEQK